VGAQQPSRDPVLRLIGFDQFIKKYPLDWEKRIHPSIKPMVEFQRMIGERATAVSFADNQANPLNPNPKARVFIMNWDGSDLFASGVTKIYNGKPVEIVPVAGPTRSAARIEVDFATTYFKPLIPSLGFQCTYNRPASGGWSIGGFNGNGTLGGAIYGRGWPTNVGWKYLVSNQHVISDPNPNNNPADALVNQPGSGCTQSSQIGNLGGQWGQGIPQHLRVQLNNQDNPNTIDAAVAYLTSAGALSAWIQGIGNPRGKYDPPQVNWEGNKTGMVSGTTYGRITDYPLVDCYGWFNLGTACFRDVFRATNGVAQGDSGSLWLDNDRRVHGMFYGLQGPNAGMYMRWQHVENGWTISIATQ